MEHPLVFGALFKHRRRDKTPARSIADFLVVLIVRFATVVGFVVGFVVVGFVATPSITAPAIALWCHVCYLSRAPPSLVRAELGMYPLKTNRDTRKLKWQCNVRIVPKKRLPAIVDTW